MIQSNVNTTTINTNINTNNSSSSSNTIQAASLAISTKPIEHHQQQANGSVVNGTSSSNSTSTLDKWTNNLNKEVTSNVNAKLSDFEFKIDTLEKPAGLIFGQTREEEQSDRGVITVPIESVNMDESIPINGPAAMSSDDEEVSVNLNLPTDNKNATSNIGNGSLINDQQTPQVPTAGANHLNHTPVNTRTPQYTTERPYKKLKFTSSRNNVVFDFVKFFVLFVFNLVVFVPLVLVLALIFCPVKCAGRLVYKLLHVCHLTQTSYISPDKVPEFLNPIELFWLYNSYLDHRPEPSILLNDSASSSNSTPTKFSLNGHRSKSGCAFIVDGSIAKAKLKDLIKNKLISSSSTSSSSSNRFSQRIYNLVLFGHVWLTCDTFDLDEHIVEIDPNLEFTSHKQVQAYLSDLVRSHNFDLAKPLWNVYYKKSMSKTDRSTLVFVLFHQSFTDGVSLVRLLFKSLADNRNQIDIKGRFAYSRFKLNVLKSYLIGWSSIVYNLLVRSSDNNPICNFYAETRKKTADSKKSPNTTATTNGDGDRVLVWSDGFDLVQLNRLKLITRSKMNDFLLSVVTGILRNYFQSKGINNPNNLTCLMPVDLRSNKYPLKLGNKSTIATFTLPVRTEGCVPRLWDTKKITYSVKSSNGHLSLYFMMNFLFSLLPTSVAFRLTKRVLDKSTCVVSTLGAGDGSSLATVSVLNQNVKNLIHFYPTVSNVPLSFSITTYADEVRLCLLVDPNVITNPDFITNQFIKKLETLNDLLSNRRLPGEIKRLHRPVIEIANFNISSNDMNMSEEFGLNDLEQKMSEIQQELQVLTESLSKLDSNSAGYAQKRQQLLIQSEKLRKEFSSILMKIQLRQNVNSQTIPSDDEDELEPEERIRLRSSSVASRVSLSSGSKRQNNRDSNSEHSSMDRPASSRKHSLCIPSRHGSFSANSSNAIDMVEGNLNNLTSLTVENEVASSSTLKSATNQNTANRESNSANSKNFLNLYQNQNYLSSPK